MRTAWNTTTQISALASVSPVERRATAACRVPGAGAWRSTTYMNAVRTTKQHDEPRAVLADVLDALEARDAQVGEHFVARKRHRARLPQRRVLDAAQLVADPLPALGDPRAQRVDARLQFDAALEGDEDLVAARAQPLAQRGEFRRRPPRSCAGWPRAPPVRAPASRAAASAPPRCRGARAPPRSSARRCPVAGRVRDLADALAQPRVRVDQLHVARARELVAACLEELQFGRERRVVELVGQFLPVRAVVQRRGDLAAHGLAAPEFDDDVVERRGAGSRRRCGGRGRRRRCRARRRSRSEDPVRHARDRQRQQGSADGSSRRNRGGRSGRGIARARGEPGSRSASLAQVPHVQRAPARGGACANRARGRRLRDRSRSVARDAATGRRSVASIGAPTARSVRTSSCSTR